MEDSWDMSAERPDVWVLREDELARLPAALVEGPATVAVVHGLRTRAAQAWVTGGLPRFSAAVVELGLSPGDLHGFGESTPLVGLIDRLGRWRSIEVAAEQAGVLTQLLQQRGHRLWAEIDLIHVPSTPPPTLAHPLVRLLDDDDRPAVERTPELFPDYQLPFVRVAVRDRRVAGAMAGGKLVGYAASLAAGESYADLGVHVLAPWRGRGIATAAASLVAAVLGSRGLVAVWSTSEDNLAARRVADKLGLAEVARRVILHHGEQQPGRLRLPPKAAPTEGRPEGAAARRPGPGAQAAGRPPRKPGRRADPGREPAALAPA
jgi:ribosomal protein S18 acetylase RimI-like enzyme